MTSKDRLYIVDGGASLHIEKVLSYRGEHKRHTRNEAGDPNREWNRPFQTRVEGLYLGVRHSPLSEVGGRFALGVVLWVIDSATSHGVLALGKQEETLTLTITEKTSAYCTDTFIPPVAVTRQTVTPKSGARRNPLPASEVEQSLRLSRIEKINKLQLYLP